MYRAVVLTTLVLLLLAVVGVSVAQEGRIFAGEPNSDDPLESTTPEQTSFEATGLEDTTTSPLPAASSETEDHQNITEPTVVTEPTGSPRSPPRLPRARRHQDLARTKSVSPSTLLRPLTPS